MKVELDRVDLESLVKGQPPHFSEFENPLVKRAGFEYNDQQARGRWTKLFIFSDQELYDLYIFCKNSWNNKVGLDDWFKSSI